MSIDSNVALAPTTHPALRPTAAPSSTQAATTTPPVAPRSRHRRYIQGLRGVAVAMVMAFHAELGIARGGFTGVDVFLVISGFVITLALLDQLKKHGRIDLGRFYLSRFRRLFPALALVVTVSAIASVFLLAPGDPQMSTALVGFGAIAFSSNLVTSHGLSGAFMHQLELNPLVPTWSLSMEEQFYFIYPLACVAALGLAMWAITRFLPEFGRPQSRFRACCLAVFGAASVITVASFGLAAVLMLAPHLAREAWGIGGYFGMPARIWEFGPGAMLAAIVVLVETFRPIDSPRRVRPTYGVAGVMAGAYAAVRPRVVAGTALAVIGVVILAYYTINEVEGPIPGVSLWWIVGGTTLLIAGCELGGRGVGTALGWGPLVWIGDHSYSLYLWHNVCVVFAVCSAPNVPFIELIAVCFSVLPAWLTTKYLEDPIRRAKSLRALWPTLRLAVVCLVVPAMACSALYAVASRGLSLAPVDRFTEQVTEQPLAARVGCGPYVLPAGDAGKACRFNEGQAGNLYLIGDIQAETMAEPIATAAGKAGMATHVSWGYRCPATRPEGHFSWVPEGHPDGICEQHSAAVATWLDTAPAGTVVIADSLEPFSYGPVSRKPRKTHYGPAPIRSASHADALTSLISRLQTAGHRVVVVRPLPAYVDAPQFFHPRWCSTLSIAASGCQVRVGLDDLPDVQKETRQLVSTVATTTGATMVDPAATLCADGMCSTRRDDVQWYRDQFTLTASGARDLQPLFDAALAAP